MDPSAAANPPAPQSDDHARAFIERWQVSGGAERANYGMFLAELCDLQLLHFTLVVGWPLLAVAAMISSRRGGLTGMPLFGWVLLVVLVPLLGALACLIVRPTDHPTDARHRDPDQGNRDGEA